MSVKRFLHAPPGERRGTPGSRPTLHPILWILFALCGVDCTRPGVPENVLLISIDSLRADHVGSYGSQNETTPTLDRLAREGVRFENAQSSTSWTLPAHVSLLTGQAQRHHQTVTSRDAIPSGEELLQEVFAQQGFETAGFYSGPYLHPVYGFGRGFQSYASCQSAEPTAPEETDDGQRTRLAETARANEHAHEDRTNPLIESAFASWVEHRQSRRFFAFVHMWDVHYDYIPPEPYASMFDPDYKGDLDGHDIAGDGFPVDAPSRDVAHLRALYDGEIRYTDATIEHLLAKLEGAGLLASTLVVVASDHGEEFLEHGGKLHGRTLYQEVIHIPLIFWARRGLPSGETVQSPVSLEDVAPTILDLLALPPLKNADGTSLVPSIRSPGVARGPVFSEFYNPFARTLKLVSIRQANSQLIFAPHANTWELYDLATDGGEQHPIPAIDPRLMAKLDEFATQGRELLAARAQLRKANTIDALPPDVAERLKALGYIK